MAPPRRDSGVYLRLSSDSRVTSDAHGKEIEHRPPQCGETRHAFASEHTRRHAAGLHPATQNRHQRSRWRTDRGHENTAATGVTKPRLDATSVSERKTFARIKERH